ncbi:hypothetical protein [Natrinema thermotolerans]|uniref:hypothetical protein n=1 Tax=Natrinema thermotolerans TaxID=121872 RepID=UPI00067852F0|nr:hypothetical protein [Natrinema thermotolerans]QCC57221.1 hypothetical protein DVR14_00680 [Natrinema thermotolerans]
MPPSNPLPVGRITTVHLALAFVFGLESVVGYALEALPALALAALWVTIAAVTEWTYRQRTTPTTIDHE